MALCVFPLWRYLRWRNRQVSDPAARLRWLQLLKSPSAEALPWRNTELELPTTLAHYPTHGKISFLGKSFGQWASGSGAATGKGSGFQVALALIGHAVSRRATDLHVGTKDDRVMLRLRVDGEIIPLEPLTTSIGLSVINIFKVLSDLDIADRRRAQDGSFRADVDGRRLYFRVSSQGTNAGEKLSIRILDPAERFSTFSTLGVQERLQQQLVEVLGRKSGLVLFAGATGAGKSTTAYAAIRHLNAGDRNIVTIEDPIEYLIPSIDQIEVRSRAGQSYESGLRSLLRQDADIVLIGEIRDEETARIACQAALTGQLVVSTIHATDSISAVLRLTDLGVDSYHIAAALRAVVSQQLVRLLCRECRVAFEADEQTLQQLGLAGFIGQLYRRPDPLVNPCLNCNGRGFLGRTGIFELLDITPPIRDLIRDRSGGSAVLSAALDRGMTTLRDDGLRLVREGIISPQEFLLSVDAP